MKIPGYRGQCLLCEGAGTVTRLGKLERTLCHRRVLSITETFSDGKGQKRDKVLVSYLVDGFGTICPPIQIYQTSAAAKRSYLHKKGKK